jgi:hypothetical protein
MVGGVLAGPGSLPLDTRRSRSKPRREFSAWLPAAKGAGMRATFLVMDGWRSRITIEPGKRGGKPCIRGLQMTV